MEISSHIHDVLYFQSKKKEFKPQEFLNAIVNIIKTNCSGCEMIFTLFTTALNSYKSGRCLKPFPPSFLQNGVEDISNLRKLCETIPSLQEFKNRPEIYSYEILELFYWLFIEKAFPLLEEVPFETIPLNSDISKGFRPDYVFKIHHCMKNDLSFKKRAGKKGIISAFHGSHVDNFFSILKFGLQQHFSTEKETIFGKGIYLSSELSISAHFSPYGQTWKKCSIGSSHSIIAICDIINDVDKVKCKDSKHKGRSINENSTGEIPEKYFIVTDNEMVQLRYLMVYKKKKLGKSCFFSNIYWMSLVLYFLMLLFIGSRGISWIKMISFIFGDFVTT